MSEILFFTKEVLVKTTSPKSFQFFIVANFVVVCVGFVTIKVYLETIFMRDNFPNLLMKRILLNSMFYSHR